jgi:two-component system response regulator (stage 0 sporulation protein F)
MDNKDIKILIVDDEEDIAVLSQKILNREGFKTFIALDGPQALEIFQKERPAINLIDVHLGYSPIDGIQVLEKIREMDKATECIMITRITDEATVAKAQKLGVKKYLYKPLDTEDWLACVQKTADEIKARGV